MTKKEYLQAIYELISSLGDNRYDEYLDFISKEINNLTVKTERAKARAQSSRADNDDLTDAIAEIVPDDYVSIPEVINLLPEFDTTPAKVAYRLNALVADGILEKTYLVENKKKIVKYKHLI